MKKIYLLFAALLVITCAKEEDPIVTPPAVVIPPPSFVIPPVTPPEPSTPPSYDGGDISISSREDLDYYREINVQNITGNLVMLVDWSFVEGSTNDPSVFTSKIEQVTGDVTINTTSEISFESLVKVGGDYFVSGHDVIDDNLLYAKSIGLDYNGDYQVKAVYTDVIGLNLSDEQQTSKFQGRHTRKQNKRNVDIETYHTSLLEDEDFTADNLPEIRTVPPTMPAIPIFVPFIQLDFVLSYDSSSTTNSLPLPSLSLIEYVETNDVSNSIISDNITNFTMGGHVEVDKIESNSLEKLEVNNTELNNLEVDCSVLEEFKMPNLIELVSIILNLPKVDKLEFPLLASITNISVTGVNEFSSPLLETIKGNFTLSGVSTAGLPKLENLGGISSLPSNVNLTTGSGAPTLDRTGTAVPTGGASTGSGTSSSVGLGNTGDSSTGDGDDTEHNSGGSGDTPHNSGGSGDTPHNSGGSGDTAHDSGGSSGSGTSGQADKTYVPDDNFEQYLIDAGYDDILDDYVLTDNIVGIEEINYINGGIKSLVGVQDFTELKRLVLFNYPDTADVNFADLQSRIDAGLKNDIQVAYLSNNKKLVYVNLGRNNSLESINVNGLTELIGLGLQFCANLPSVNLGTNTKLQWLDFGFNNKITEVDLTNLQELGHLSFRATSNLNSLDISNNDKIVDLDVEYTNLNCIKVSEYQIQNQINAKSIDGESSILVKFSESGGQIFDVSWAKDSTTIFSLDCN